MTIADRVTAIIVPQGKLLDFIDGKIRNETPEEYVRQEIEKSLVREYRYGKEEMAIEFRLALGRATKRADIVIFPEGAAAKQEHVWAVIECKSADVSPNHKDEGVEQLKSYLAACVNAEFGMWTNGQERFCFRKTGRRSEPFVELPDIPVKGKTLEDAERPDFSSLRPATSDSLLFTFRRCHNYIAGNQGLQKPEAFWELLKLIFCKIEDERAPQLTFFATTQERQSMNGQLKVKHRLDELFARVREKYEAIFRANEVIELEPRVLAYLVSQLQPWSLLDSDIDVKGKAYEEIVGANLRGDRGEFFTPRNICRMAVLMLDPSPTQLVLDPSCGTGGFLTIAMNHVIEKIRASEQLKWRNREHPTQREHEEVFRKVQRYADRNMVGIDINPNLVKAAKMNMVMNNDGSGGLYQGNSLERPVTWSAALRNRDLMAQVDLIFTNPPFGSRIPVDDPAILEQYELAHVWDYDEQRDRFVRREPRQLQKSLPPEILFVERCVQFLKPGTGRVAIVLPDGILGSPGLAYVRDWILTQTRVLASVDLHADTFQPGNSTQTSVLFLERKRFDEIELERAAGQRKNYDIFMALANRIGHDKRGNDTYVRDENGDEIVVEVPERVPEVREGTPVYRTSVTRKKVRDDNTADIAAAFRAFLASRA